MTIPDDLITREHLKTLLRIKSNKTIKKYEKQGMPVLTIGRLKRYDYKKVLKWLNTQYGGNK